MRNEDKTIIIGSILFGLFIIGLGNIEQYENTSEYFGMGGLIFIVWAWAYYLALKEEKPKVVGKKNIEELEYTSIFKNETKQEK